MTISIKSSSKWRLHSLFKIIFFLSGVYVQLTWRSCIFTTSFILHLGSSFAFPLMVLYTTLGLSLFASPAVAYNKTLVRRLKTHGWLFDEMKYIGLEPIGQDLKQQRLQNSMLMISLKVSKICYYLQLNLLLNYMQQASVELLILHYCVIGQSL